MKIAVLEHFTAQPEGGPPPGPVAEGRAMRDAIVADLRRLPGVVVEIVERRRFFRGALRRADAALVIAPETRGILARLSRAVEDEGCRLLGPSAGAVRLAADKLGTARCLQAAGVLAPRTEAVRFASARRSLRAWPVPFVVKPRDGCGCQGVVVVPGRREIDHAIRSVRRATRRADFLVQEYVRGQDASVSVIAAGGLLTLGLNRQRLRGGRTPAYAGGETFYPHRLAPAAAAAARAAVAAFSAACPGVRGYVGVDLVLGDSEATVIEINPRLTTSYVGLRLSVEENIAGLIIGAALGRALPERVTVRRRCRFRADGNTALMIALRPQRKDTEGTRGWPIISAGTSAASI